MMLKTAAFAPIPRPSVSTTVAVKRPAPGEHTEALPQILPDRFHGGLYGE